MERTVKIIKTGYLSEVLPLEIRLGSWGLSKGAGRMAVIVFGVGLGLIQ